VERLGPCGWLSHVTSRGAGLSLALVLSYPGNDQRLAWEEDDFLLQEAPGLQDMKSWVNPGSACVPRFPMSTSASHQGVPPALRGPGTADSHHGAVHIHPFVAL
jgi:hypothetical protein